MRVTIKDIAQEVGLSVSSVSLVLNNKPCRISEKNKELIREVAKKKGYCANNIARSLVTKKTNMFALIIPDIENMFFSSLAKSIEDYCRAKGYVLIITNSNDKADEDEVLLRQIIARGVDGIFVIVSNESYKQPQKIIDILETLPVPYVMVDRIYNTFECDKIYFNNESGAYEAVRHLLELGHRKIACVTNSTSYNGRIRLEGYLKAMKEYGCEIKEDYIIEGKYKVESGMHAAEKILQTDVTGAFICSDMMAIGVLKTLYSKGIEIPRDFSVVSYDNAFAKYMLEVGLTSVEQNPQKLGQYACETLFEKVSGQDDTKKEIALIPELIIRNSVKQI